VRAHFIYGLRTIFASLSELAAWPHALRDLGGGNELVPYLTPAAVVNGDAVVGGLDNHGLVPVGAERIIPKISECVRDVYAPLAEMVLGVHLLEVLEFAAGAAALPCSTLTTKRAVIKTYSGLVQMT
jgi:hypothetical protein